MKSVRLFFAQMCFRLMPETRCFAIKNALLRWAGAEIGKGVRVCSSVRIYGVGNLEIGDGSWIGHHDVLVCSDDIIIGRYVNIAPMCFIGTGTHEIDYNGEGKSVADKCLSLPIVIGDGCWICAGCIILGGANLGARSVLAAGSVIKSSVEGHYIYAGSLAKPVKKIF